MRRRPAATLVFIALAGCASEPRDSRTLAALRDVEPELSQVEVGDSLGRAMEGYREFLEEAPVSELTPEAMRRLADLKLEREFGPLGDAARAPLPVPAPAPAIAEAGPRAAAGPSAARVESDAAFEQRALGATTIAEPRPDPELALPDGSSAAAGPSEAIALYDRILSEYPSYRHNDRVLYQKARALDELGRIDEAIGVAEQLITQHPQSRHVDELQFRRAEYFFTRRRWRDAENAYAAITRRGAGSEYYEPALYKLGWAYYKQDLLEEALDEYVRLLDHKVSTGYDFDQSHDKDTERRIADTFRVISLSFSNLGGPESVSSYFAAKGERGYEDRIYAQLGEFYLEKLRYADAAKSYRAFVALHPLHASSPRFSMRVIEIFEAGGFPKLVLEAKKEFAATYGLDAEYWRHFDVAAAGEVVAYLKRNLSDLANHHHASFQAADLAAEKPANFAEAQRWYRAYLASFPREPESPGINHRLADLLLEQRAFAEAAREYERTAYEYPAHERAPAAGYAAIFALREQQKVAASAEQEAARREAVHSTLRFVAAFPQHEHAADVLGAAVDDLYDLKEHALAIEHGRKLIADYPGAKPELLRSAWIAVAHSAFELASYVDAEQAYARVLALTPADDASRAGFADNLAAAVYKQGEQANAAGQTRAAADHFLRVAEVAPESSIRPAAEYDGAAALVALEDWAGAAAVLEAFRAAHAEHELAREATKQLAFVYRKQGDSLRAAAEYERVASEADRAELRAEALLLAGELYEGAKRPERAIAAYLHYADEFAAPVETAVETRAKVAALYEAAGDHAARREQLRAIVALDAQSGAARTPRTRTLAAQSALVLAEDAFHELGALRLAQPLEQNLAEKQRRMDAALSAFAGLVDYEVGEVTAAATFYTAECYGEFARALAESERPADLSEDERSAYEAGLDEESFGFEEKAIAVHEKNRELIRIGLWNPWIEKSLARLATLVPGRYAREEASSGVLTLLESYAYRAPASESVAQEPATRASDESPTPLAAGGNAESVAAPQLGGAPTDAEAASSDAGASPALEEGAGAPPPANAEEDLLPELEEFLPTEANDVPTL
jgi:outer membrane protein assembly factor BamD (BamD/ComL family)